MQKQIQINKKNTEKTCGNKYTCKNRYKLIKKIQKKHAEININKYTCKNRYKIINKIQEKTCGNKYE